ncbi:uncharacterized protein ARMOST_08146 [Armillaria ostoyae]|uniref:OST48 N-terminal domain-containing protein n=1 Tax=Armillaria ostoyae TaxID=47428 RepID=A0A284R7T5_ARMOS|nr:uncharacterized protein ARMOST_08146 [Armillaria ostoyae]
MVLWYPICAWKQCSILNAPEESFAADSDSATDTFADAAEKGGEGLWAGSQLGVVSGFQVLNGARVAWVDGVDLFSDKFANKEISKYMYASSSFRCVILILSKECEIREHIVRACCRGLDVRRVLVLRGTDFTLLLSTIPAETRVELVVEAKPHDGYIGADTSVPPLDGEEKLPEWIKLDAQTKTAYCTAVSRILKEQMPYQPVSCANIQQQFDLGEYSAPCYSLQCVGYDFALQVAFVKGSTSQPSDIDTSRASQNTLLSAVKSLHAMWRVDADPGRSHSTSTKKRSPVDYDEASVTKKARADGLPAGKMHVYDED